jgi:hypothetical protein
MKNPGLDARDLEICFRPFQAKRDTSPGLLLAQIGYRTTRRGHRSDRSVSEHPVVAVSHRRAGERGDCEPPKPRIEAVRVVDMNASNSWAEFAGLFRDTQGAHADHERAKNELKGLMPEDAKEAMGHGIRAKRSKSGAVSFDLVEMEASHASVQ